MLEVTLEDKQFISPTFCNLPCAFCISSFSQSTVRRSIKWINTFCRKNSVSFVRMRRLKDLDMSLKTLDHLHSQHRFMV
jgi:hypothetical protein